MRYVSTRQGPEIALEDAIMSGTAPDGGLYVPTSLPHFEPADFDGIDGIDELAAKMLKPSTISGHRTRSACSNCFAFNARKSSYRCDKGEALVSCNSVRSSPATSASNVSDISISTRVSLTVTSAIAGRTSWGRAGATQIQRNRNLMPASLDSRK